MWLQAEAGLDYFPRIPKEKACSKEQHHMIQSEVWEGMEEARANRIMCLRQQEVWMIWEYAVQHWITWANILQITTMSRFLIQAVYDIMPSFANLWKEITRAHSEQLAKGS